MRIEEFIEEQLKERYKHFIIYGSPMQGKTKFAKAILNIFTGMYIDLLNVFESDSNKKNNIDIFGPSKLILLIKEYYEVDIKILVIDQMDFLINTWSENEFREFLVFVDQNQSNQCCIFIMHNYRILEREKLIKDNDKGNKRLLSIFEIHHGG
ncbi:AAA family ATPase [Clostridium lacusfryxellense]|uniref:AAA family ATPase n=1 Tax=Clostridium lacusfryxellense TaxID=205328 RepID=UPI001C0B33EA|nr:AAA family ATPase [Clostridium lacusfryxellense]MBU3114584.1 AAA family ATPase [Clostridium lacusfryxellense]